jgi:hypothetical protein
MTQLSVSDIFGSVKDSVKANEKIMEILDKHGTPHSPEETKAIATEIADMLSDMILEVEEVNRKIGVELEFIGDKPRFALFDVPNGACGTCS